MDASSAIDEFFLRHERIMLQFSGGKDSAATLWLLQPWWDRMDVVWSNSGNPYPETLDYMTEIEKLVPRFFVVRGSQPTDIAANGWPVDVLPFEASAVGRTLSRQSEVPLRLFWECCWNNLWKPMQDFAKQGNYDGIIRGQKSSDTLKAPLNSLSIIDGVEYFHPIESWTDEQVFEFLGPDRTPASYKRGLKTSLGCINCTAYVGHNPGRMKDLEQNFPKVFQEITPVHLRLLDLLSGHVQALRDTYA